MSAKKWLRMLPFALAAALLAVQVLFVVLTTRYLKDHFALIYGALEGIALITALYIYNKPGDLSYRVAWIIPILFVPVVGLILYLLWGGDTQRKRLQPPPARCAGPQRCGALPFAVTAAFSSVLSFPLVGLFNGCRSSSAAPA